MIKIVHISAVLLSGSFFVIRGFAVLYGASFMQLKIVKIAPHVIDTVLLVSAIILSIQLQQYPFVDHWITVKVFALIVYIVLGTIVIKRGKTQAQRVIAFVLAILVFLFMISVARSHDPLGIITYL